MGKIELKDFLKFKSLLGLKSNKSKTMMAFCVSSVDEEKNEYTFDLYTHDGTKTKKVANLKNKNSFLFEDDDNLLISFAKTKKDEKRFTDGYTLYYRYSIKENTLKLAYEFPFSTSIIKVLEDKLLLQSSLRVSEHALYEDISVDRKTYKEQLNKDSLYVVTERLPFYFNGRGFTEGLFGQILVYSIKSKTYQNLFEKTDNVSLVNFSNDETKAFFMLNNTNVAQLTNKLYEIDFNTYEVKTLYDQLDLAISNVFELKDKFVVFATDMKKIGLNQNPDVYELKNGVMSKRVTYGKSVGNSVGTDVRYGGSKSDIIFNDRYYFVTTIDDHNEINTLDSDFNVKVVFVANGSIDGLTLINNEFYAISLYKQKLQELYLLDINNQKLIQKTRYNQNSLKGKHVFKPKVLTFKKNGVVIKGFVLLPKDYDGKKKFKAVLDIHGGPKTVYGQVYYHEMQYWASLGYVVFFLNPRGSDGKGDEFCDIFGKYGTIDYDDIMEFTDRVIKKYDCIDESNIFVTGGSYGGFMTNWIVSQTNRFKAAATQRSISNWISFYGTSDIGFYFVKDQTKGHPTKNFDLLWQQSPMKYASDVKTPLLFIHSDEDYRCPIEQALQFYAVIKENNIDTKFVWFKGENHELSRGGKPQARVKRLEEITSWFLKHSN